MSCLPNPAVGVCVHLEKIAEVELWRLSIFVDGSAVGKHTLQRVDIGPVLLSGLGQAVSEYVGSSPAIDGALAWSPQLPAVPSKQEVRQVVGVLAGLWRLIRGLLG